MVNIPHPFGGTPAFEALRREGRILESLPFSFYYSPYLATIPRHYDPIAYYDCLIELFRHFTSPRMLARRLATTRSPYVALVHVTRTRVKRRRLGALRALRDGLRSDASLLAFHEGRTRRLPTLYRREYEALLGPFAALMSAEESRPVLDAVPPIVA